MADQAAGTMAGDAQMEPHGQASLTRDAPAHPGEHGRATSWAAATIVFVGFLIGGIALPSARRGGCSGSGSASW